MNRIAVVGGDMQQRKLTGRGEESGKPFSTAPSACSGGLSVLLIQRAVRRALLSRPLCDNSLSTAGQQIPVGHAASPAGLPHDL
jgi:hypothetical protein